MRFRFPFSWRFRRWLRTREQSEYALTIFYALLIGGGVGVVGALFYRVLLLVQKFFFRASEEDFASLPGLTLLLVPIFGGVIQAALTRMYPDVASRKGVVEVMKSLKLKQGVISAGTTLFHMVAPVIAIGTGGSVGPEGPACQLGAGIASRIGQMFRVSPGRLKVMVAAGSGAAISAIFNAPLGGVFFALEIILLNDLKDVTFGVLILASVVANVVSHALLGGHSLFQFPPLELPAVRLLPIFLLLGMLGGLLSVGFMKWSGTLAKLVWGRWRNVPRWVFPPLAGLLLGITAQWFPDVLGVGYHGIQTALSGEYVLLVGLALLVLKVLLTGTTIELGGFGGTFAPSLFIGAMLGGVVAQLAAMLHLPISAPLLVLTGMGTVLAGMNGIPLTAFLLLVELTGNYDMVLPMMIAVSGTTMVIQFIVHERSLYIFKLKKARLYSEKDGATMLAETSIRELMKPMKPVVKSSSPLQTVVPLFAELDLKDLVVVDEANRVTGMLDFADLRHIIAEFEALKIIRVAELAETVPIVHAETSLAEFQFLARDCHSEYLPVCDRDGQLLGIVFQSAVNGMAQTILRSQQEEQENNRWAFK
ncbi:MAG: chloride channel protein [Candidatus Delongbacteria bacterium]|nr:chloride channel protein [Candidatus Cloacimonadota bacterium]MCB9475065.1 chloride channel protein [Candidatus Delongbacteria bacterium]